MPFPSYARPTAASRKREEARHQQDYVPLRQRASARYYRRASFLGLPSELRVEIYRALFFSDANPVYLMNAFKASPLTALLRVCRTTRNEVSRIYYAKAQFRVAVVNFDFMKLIRWLELLGPGNRRYLACNPNLHIHLVFGREMRFFFDRRSGRFFPTVFEPSRPSRDLLEAWIRYHPFEEQSQINWHYSMLLGWEPQAFRNWFHSFPSWLQKTCTSRETQKIVNAVIRVKDEYEHVGWESRAESSEDVGWVVYKPARH